MALEVQANDSELVWGITSSGGERRSERDGERSSGPSHLPATAAAQVPPCTTPRTHPTSTAHTHPAIGSPHQASTASLRPAAPASLPSVPCLGVGDNARRCAPPVESFPGVKGNARTIPAVAASFPAINCLVVEDNAVNRFVVLRMLSRLQVDADVAADGVQAVEACKKCTYDLILMDIHMPEMDGFEATTRIRAHQEECNLHFNSLNGRCDPPIHTQGKQCKVPNTPFHTEALHVTRPTDAPESRVVPTHASRGVSRTDDPQARRTSEEIRSRRPMIVALTAGALKHERERCEAVGMDGFLTKPLRLQDLEHVLRSVSLRNDCTEAGNELPKALHT